MRKILLQFAVILSAYLYSQQGGFQYATTDNKGVDYYFKLEGSNLYGLSQKVWIKYTAESRKIKNKKGKLINSGGGKVLTLFDISCQYNTYQILNTIKYNKNGDVIWSNNIPSSTENVVAGSVMEGIYEAICAKK
ncbi:hypothetical protein EG349_12480 [Chryseobacterium shandongense]|uniref:Surface-adhesin protein E-like domain-containing protein n=1 Tax=Chryseobacterium shandongense TaxID=1493872 RepID=A0AAD0YEI8_9FLAO|nr:surface-adhesin E family protein [Chryseobacterium shandongense]AZA87550.1 hypothetical protein EG349_12480 [Chryseobacterium shandongense]AZA96051.1 hypothetical protein EG353_10950 [Chryseobacterium shandongense]